LPRRLSYKKFAHIMLMKSPTLIEIVRSHHDLILEKTILNGNE